MALPRVPLRRLAGCGLGQQGLRGCRSPFRPQLAPTFIRGLQSSCHRLKQAQSQTPGPEDSAKRDQNEAGLRKEWVQYTQLPKASKACHFVEGQKVTIHGFLSKKRVQSSALVFADIHVEGGPKIQVKSEAQDRENPKQNPAHTALRSIQRHSPVAVTGTVVKLHTDATLEPVPFSAIPSVPGRKPDAFPNQVSRIDLDLESIQPLNQFPKDIIVSDNTLFPNDARHLQIRFQDDIRSRLLIRSQIAFQLRTSLNKLGLTEVETPILFKSTPEGAREFIVPTRRAGRAYALPQSPQQYKQMLMASGIPGYFQFARCFRDEDLRADRQPEFTQLDLEEPFATGEDVMQTVETIITDLTYWLTANFTPVEKKDEVCLVPKTALKATEPEYRDPILMSRYPKAPFPRISYNDAMSKFGIDKPDMRIPFEIHRVDHILPKPFISMISRLEGPHVDAIKFRPSTAMGNMSEFIGEFLKSLPTALANNPDGKPAALVVDSRQPLRGLSPLGFDGVEALEKGGPGLETFTDLEDGDVVIFQARENKPFQGEGSTALGTIRSLLYQEAVTAGLLPRDTGFRFLWVTGFPMFTPNNETDPGQGGKAGFSATHHPFTAPLTDKDAELLATDPLKAKADHYDLVVNGVELGGGSRRIHVAKMQEYVMKEVLQMTDQGIAQFSHLLNALRAGCPPHAGFALGFDRLVAVLTYTNSVRDVIAFPKSMKGEDLAVKSPGRITSEELATYHLQLAKKK